MPMSRLQCVFAIVLGSVVALALDPKPAMAQGVGSDKKDDKNKDKKDDKERPLEFAGKTLDQWAKEISSKDRSRAETAIKSIQLFPVEKAYSTVPVMIKELKKHAIATPVDTSIRVHLAIAIGNILGAVKGAETNVLSDAVTQLTKMLRDPQAVVRYRAVEALGKLGPEGKQALPEILPLLKDATTWEIRHAAAQSIGALAYDDKAGPSVQILNTLFGCLSDSSSQVRMSAIQSLTYLGGPVDPTVRLSLVKALESVAAKDPDQTVTIWANMAIMSVTDNITIERVAPIQKLLKSTDPLVRIQSAQAIGTIGSKARSAVPNLIELLDDSDLNLVATCAWALGKIGPFASEGIPALARLSRSDKMPDPIKNLMKESIDQIQGKSSK